MRTKSACYGDSPPPPFLWTPRNTPPARRWRAEPAPFFVGSGGAERSAGLGGLGLVRGGATLGAGAGQLRRAPAVKPRQARAAKPAERLCQGWGLGLMPGCSAGARGAGQFSLAPFGASDDERRSRPRRATFPSGKHKSMLSFSVSGLRVGSRQDFPGRRWLRLGSGARGCSVSIRTRTRRQR